MKRRMKTDRGWLYRLAFEQSRDSIIILELPENGTPLILFANPAAEALHGFRPGELEGRPITVLGASPRSARGGEAYEVEHRRPGGKPLVTEVTARNIRVRGKLYGILVERDITWRRRLEREARDFSGRLLREREEQKRRLAAGIHDALGAMAVGISAELLLAEEAAARGEGRRAMAALQRARDLLGSSSAALRKACVESWPPSLAVAGLKAALCDLAAAFERRSGIRVKAHIAPGAEGPLRGSTTEIAVYRLAQEALLNAERHSGARRLELALVRRGSCLELEVRDDGRGFDTAAAARASDSLGLKIMADTAAAAGGRFQVSSASGKGARITASIPFKS
jgi:PAS domain S-box-containing protein